MLQNGGRAKEELDPRHFAYIDALRGLAFLAVLCVHSTDAFVHFPGIQMARQGHYGVELFFLASAITLCLSMSARREGDERYVNFYVRRLFRIAPLFWAGILLYWTVPDIIPRIWLLQFAPGGVEPAYFLATALFVHGWHPYTINSIVPGGWSIAVEMTFYVLFPLCFNCIGRLSTALIWAALTCVFTLMEKKLFFTFAHYLWPSVSDQFVLTAFKQMWFPSQFVVFVFGILIFHLLKLQTVRRLISNRRTSCLLFLLSVCSLCALLHYHENGDIAPLLATVAMSGVVVSVAGRAVPFFVNPLICRVGQLSYSCYITHFACLAFVIKIFGWYFPKLITSAVGGELKFDAGGQLANLASYITITGAALIVTLAFSTVTNRYVESPGIKAGKLLIKRIHRMTASGP